MVENRPVFSSFLSHLVLILGVAAGGVSALPHPGGLQPSHGGKPHRPHPGLVRRRHAYENYHSGAHLHLGHHRQPCGGPHDAQFSLIMAIGIAVGKVIISIISAYAIDLFQVPAAQAFFLAYLHHPDAAGGGAHPAHLQGDRGPESLGHLFGGLIVPFDRIGHGHLFVPPVFSHHTGGAFRGGSRIDGGRAPSVSFSSAWCCPFRAPTWRRFSSFYSFMAGTSICGPFW